MMNNLDEIIATKVMGWVRGYAELDTEPAPHWFDPGTKEAKELAESWSPSARIEHAWMVVEHLMPNDDEFRLTKFQGQGWRCTFCFFNGLYVEAEYAPEAICMAALQAVELAK